MKTQILTTEFKNILKVMDKIKDKEFTPASDLLVISKDDTSKFIKTNSETTIIYSMLSYIQENGSIMLPGDTAEVIKKLKEDSLILTNNKIKTERKEILFSEQSPITINTYENINKIFSVTQKELLRMLEVTYTTAKDESRPILTGVCFNKNEVAALDAYRMSIRKSTQYNNDLTFVVNQFSINILKSILKDSNDIVNVYHDMNNTVKFEVDNIIIIAKCLEEEYIKYQSIIPQEYRYKSTLNPGELIEEIDFIKAADDRNIIKTTFTEDKVTFKGSQCRKEYSEEKSYKDQEQRQKPLTKQYKEKHDLWLEKRKLAESKGKQFKTKEPICKQAKFIKQYDLIPVNDITSNISAINELSGENEFIIAFNPKYVIDAAKLYKDKVELQMTSNVSPIVITDDIEQGLELVLPVRLLNNYN